MLFNQMSPNNTTKLLLLFLTILSTFAILHVNNVPKCKASPPLSPAETQLTSNEEPLCSFPSSSHKTSGGTDSKQVFQLPLNKGHPRFGKEEIKTG
jgi:hypothetical protein